MARIVGMQVKLVMFKGAQRKDFDLSGDSTIIGRKDDCGLRIPITDVSRHHCQVTIGGDKVVAKDLGSSNGTFVNERRITEQALRPGDVLRVGPVAFTVQIDGKPAQIASPDELAAVMGDDDDSGIIPELEMEEIGSGGGGAGTAESDDPLEGLELLEADEDDETQIGGKGKA